MTPDDYERFFHHLTGNPPFPYQRRLAEDDWPDLLQVPTGLGKTAAVVVGWLWKRLHGEPSTGRRLVYCLPMRTLVRQTRDEASGWCARAAERFGGTAPTVQALLGGDVGQAWDGEPDGSQILVGTQDLLLSRALGRGYAMSRYRWPMHFGLLNEDCLWVFDETQLMGVGIETGAQLDGLRRKLGTFGPARSLWMSATLGEAQLATVDHPKPESGWRSVSLGPDDHRIDRIRERVSARKKLIRESLTLSSDDTYVSGLAERVRAAATARGGLTLVVVNRVDRAQRVYRQLGGADDPAVGLVHSRFRPPDREAQERILFGDGDRIVVATQAVEAGIDVSARTLFTELAPWPSLVQRFGRCNRYGELDDGGEIHWLPADTSSDDLALPYRAADLEEAADLLQRLQAGGDDAGPESLSAIEYEPRPVVRPVLRRRDLLQLFDTTPDLLGNDVDVSRFVRDENDTDVRFFWRSFEGRDPKAEEVSNAPGRDELVAVSIGSAQRFFDDLTKERQRRSKKDRDGDPGTRLRAWRWDGLAEEWRRVERAPRPGDTLLLHVEAGGYNEQLGWTGEAAGAAVDELADLGAGPLDGMQRDGGSHNRHRWVPLSDHLVHVSHEARELASSLALDEHLSDALVEAARWHDVGKAHPEFQHRLVSPVADTDDRPPRRDELWAKSAHRKRAESDRPHFRHELASALAFLQTSGATSETDRRRTALVAFLIAAHHGKVRLSIRSVAGEQQPTRSDRPPLVRGLAEGDLLPALTLPDGVAMPEVRLSLAPVELGEGSWQERVLGLRDDPTLGPFRLAWLEAVLRAADERASRKEDDDA